MTQFGGRGGRGAEQQCRKRRGSSEDGGVTPLKVKQLNYHTNGRCFSSSGTSRVSTENMFAVLLLWRVEVPSVIWRWGVRNALFVQLRNGRCFSLCVLFFFSLSATIQCGDGAKMPWCRWCVARVPAASALNGHDPAVLFGVSAGRSRCLQLRFPFCRAHSGRFGPRPDSRSSRAYAYS